MLAVTSVLFCCGHTILTCHVMSHCGAAIVFLAIAVITNSRLADILSLLDKCTDNFSDDGSDLEKACHSLNVIQDSTSICMTLFIAEVCFAVAMNIACLIYSKCTKAPVFNDEDGFKVPNTDQE